MRQDQTWQWHPAARKLHIYNIRSVDGGASSQYGLPASELSPRYSVANFGPIGESDGAFLGQRPLARACSSAGSPNSQCKSEATRTDGAQAKQPGASCERPAVVFWRLLLLHVTAAGPVEARFFLVQLFGGHIFRPVVSTAPGTAIFELIVGDGRQIAGVAGRVHRHLHVAR